MPWQDARVASCMIPWRPAPTMQGGLIHHTLHTQFNDFSCQSILNMIYFK